MQLMDFLIRLFRRETTSKEFIPVIDGLRFLAILMVVLFHANGYVKEKSASLTFLPENAALAQIPNVFPVMNQGVQLFFVISGFILTIPFMRYYMGLSERKPGLRAYFLRRLTRLEPPYIVSTILLFLMLIFIFSDKFSLGTLIPSFFCSLFYVHNIFYPGELPYVNPVTWSLEVEVQYYILAPFFVWALCLVKNKFRRRMLTLVLIIAFAWLGWMLDIYWQVQTFSLAWFLQYFFSGILLCDIYLFDRGKLDKLNHWVVFLLGLIILLPVISVEHSQTPDLLLRIASPLMILAFYLIVFGNRWWNKIFSLNGMTLIGGMCYSIYLLHAAVISAIGSVTITGIYTDNFVLYYWVQVFIYLLTILAVCSIYFLLIEKPCMKPDWPTRLWGKFSLAGLFGNKTSVKNNI